MLWGHDDFATYIQTLTGCLLWRLENPSFARPFLNITLLQNLQIIDSFFRTFSQKLVELKRKIVEAVPGLLPLLISSFLFFLRSVYGPVYMEVGNPR